MVRNSHFQAEPQKHSQLQRSGSASSVLPTTEVDFVSEHEGSQIIAVDDDKINFSQTLFPFTRARNVIGSTEKLKCLKINKKNQWSGKNMLITKSGGVKKKLKRPVPF